MPTTEKVMEQVKDFVIHQPKPGDLPGQLRDTYGAVREFLDTDELMKLHWIKRSREFPALRRLMRSTRLPYDPARKHWFYHGTGDVCLADPVCEDIYYDSAPGRTHAMENDGHKVFEHGLSPWGVGKMVLAAGSYYKDKRLGGMRDIERIQWCENVTGYQNLHIGGRTFIDRRGNPHFVGVSGAELTRLGLEHLIARLTVNPKISIDGDFTAAGLWDDVIAEFIKANHVYPEYPVQPDEAQIIVNQEFQTLEGLDRQGGIPRHFH